MEDSLGVELYLSGLGMVTRSFVVNAAKGDEVCRENVLRVKLPQKPKTCVSFAHPQTPFKAINQGLKTAFYHKSTTVVSSVGNAV